MQSPGLETRGAPPSARRRPATGRGRAAETRGPPEALDRAWARRLLAVGQREAGERLRSGSKRPFAGGRLLQQEAARIVSTSRSIRLSRCVTRRRGTKRTRGHVRAAGQAAVGEEKAVLEKGSSPPPKRLENVRPAPRLLPLAENRLGDDAPDYHAEQDGTKLGEGV